MTAGDRVIRRNDFGGRLEPIRRPHVLSVVPERVWSADEWAVIRAGYRAPSSDERWHAIVEDDRLFFFRSWTGRGIVEAQFVLRDDGRVITQVVVEADPDRYRRGSDGYESLLLRQLIESVLFDRWDKELASQVEQLRT